jgi:hypothetical protein
MIFPPYGNQGRTSKPISHSLNKFYGRFEGKRQAGLLL